MTYTYTYSKLEVSADAHAEIARRLKAAGAEEAVRGKILDMHGVALVPVSRVEDTLATPEGELPCEFCGHTFNPDDPLQASFHGVTGQVCRVFMEVNPALLHELCAELQGRWDEGEGR